MQKRLDRFSNVNNEFEIQVPTDIGSFQGGRVVDAVTGDGHNRSESLETFDDDQFLLRRSSRENDFRVRPGKKVAPNFAHIQ